MDDSRARQLRKHGRVMKKRVQQRSVVVSAARMNDKPRRLVDDQNGIVLVHDRKRAEALWSFFYRLEMYVPRAKREYGYYVLPILRGDRLIGRIEPSFDRKTGVLRVLGVFAEPGAPAGAGAGIASAARRLAKWLGATEIVYPRAVPAIWKKALR